MYVGTENYLRQLLAMRREMETENAIAIIDKQIHKEKLGLRNRYRLQVEYDDGWETHVIGDGYDSVYGKKVIDYEMTPEEIEDYIEGNWCRWYNPYNDGRDCTGVWFTTRIRCFPVNGKTFIYHFKACDV